MDEITPKQLSNFQKHKQQCLGKEDLSRKGSIDGPIRELVNLINACEYYYTTSTCSGRVSLIEKPYGNAASKKGGNFLLNCHDEVSFDLFSETLKTFVERSTNEDTCLWLKYEPFIMHVQCFNLDKAHLLLKVAIALGYRNSGITLGKNEKYLTAVRSTWSMEVPLYCGKRFELAESYLRFLNEECNRRLRENLSKLERFFVEVRSIL